MCLNYAHISVHLRTFSCRAETFSPYSNAEVFNRGLTTFIHMSITASRMAQDFSWFQWKIIWSAQMYFLFVFESTRCHQIGYNELNAEKQLTWRLVKLFVKKISFTWQWILGKFSISAENPTFSTSIFFQTNYFLPNHDGNRQSLSTWKQNKAIH